MTTPSSADPSSLIGVDVLEAMLDGIPTAPGWVVDVDPQSMM